MQTKRMNISPQISVVIPAYKEGLRIASFLEYIQKNSSAHVKEIIVATGSADSTALIALRFGVKVAVVGTGRAAALNAGARIASGNILYFLHADSQPPPGWDNKIVQAYIAGISAGTFRLRFDDNHPMLSFFAWFTRFRWRFIRFGDQSLFVKREVFEKIEGYDEKLRIMEDREIIDRIKQHSKFIVIPKYIVTSARKYQKHGYWRLQCAYIIVNIMYYLKFSHGNIVAFYNKFL